MAGLWGGGVVGWVGGWVGGWVTTFMSSVFAIPESVVSRICAFQFSEAAISACQFPESAVSSSPNPCFHWQACAGLLLAVPTSAVPTVEEVVRARSAWHVSK